jgi:hypothetical protein
MSQIAPSAEYALPSEWVFAGLSSAEQPVLASFLLVVSSVADAGLVTADAGRLSGGALVSVQAGG